MSEERPAPCDEAAERSVLGSALVFASDAMTRIGTLAVDDFMFPTHREAWAAIQAVIERRMPVDMISVGDEVRARGSEPRFPGSWNEWAVSVSSAATALEHVSSHADVVRDKAALRKLLRMAVEVQCTAYEGQHAADVILRAREALAALDFSGNGKGPRKLETLLSGAMETIDKRQRGELEPGVMTGITELDDLLRGMKPDRLYILGGRPGDGKTSLAMTIAQNASMRGVPVLVFSREMPTSELVEGVLSRESKIPAYDITGAKLDVAAWKKLQSAAGSVYGASLWLDDETRTIEGMCAASMLWHAQSVAKHGDPNPMALVVLDYLQLSDLAKVPKGATRENVVAAMSRALKGLAKELHAPVLTLSQLNRGAEERGGRPIPSDLRESGAIEQDADVIMFVYREIDPADQAARRQPGPGEVVIGKHRGGPTGIANAYFDTPMMTWKNLDRNSVEPPDNTRENWQDGREER
jgi:replicative DNA helicase